MALIVTLRELGHVASTSWKQPGVIRSANARPPQRNLVGDISWDHLFDDHAAVSVENLKYLLERSRCVNSLELLHGEIV